MVLWMYIINSLQAMQSWENFHLLKNGLICKPLLNLYNQKYVSHVFVDVSTIVIGSVIKQPDDFGTIAYHCRSLKSYEKYNSTTELLTFY